MTIKTDAYGALVVLYFDTIVICLQESCHLVAKTEQKPHRFLRENPSEPETRLQSLFSKTLKVIY